MDIAEWARPQGEVPGIEVVGPTEVAERLGVQRATVDRWRQREAMPAATWQLAGGPVWLWSDIEAWARRTGRL